MDSQRLMRPLNDTLMGLSVVTSAVAPILTYMLLAFEALISRGWGQRWRGRCGACPGARYPHEQTSRP